MTRDEYGVTRPRGLCTCGSMLCAGCGPARCRAACVQLELVLEQVRERYPDCVEVMLTSTVPHLATDTVAQTVYVLYKAREALRQTPEWRALDEEFGIVVDVSALDVVFGGPNGTHPHFHGLLVFECLPPVSPRASVEAELHQLLAEQDRELWFKNGPFARWATEFAPGEKKKPLHGRTPKDIADSPTTARIIYLRQILDDMLGTFANASTLPFRDASLAFQRAFLADIQARLVPAWTECVERFMLRGDPEADEAEQDHVRRGYGRAIDDRAAFDRQALDLIPAQHAASYVVGWGLEQEISATTSKGQSHLRLLDLMGSWRTAAMPWQQNAAQTARQLYRDFIVAMRRRPWLYGLTAACKEFGITREIVAERSAHLRTKRLEAAKKDGTPLVTPLEYVVRRRHWAIACRYGLGPTVARVDETARRLEAAGYRTARQRAAPAVAAGLVAADRQLSLERLRAQGGRDVPPVARSEPVLDLEAELQLELDCFLERLALAFHAEDRERNGGHRGGCHGHRRGGRRR